MEIQQDRLTDAYLNEATELERYRAEMGKMRARRSALEQTAKELDQWECHGHDSREASEHLYRFCRQVSDGLGALNF